jgi:dienelactone hydrolase
MKLSLAFVMVLVSQVALAADPLVQNLWPGEIPGPPSIVQGEERDLTKDTDRLIAGKRIIKLGHVRTPQMQVTLPPKDKANGAAVVVCPGGGFNILAWDLEGTEVAEWLNSIGYAAVVVKYRVPTNGQSEKPDTSHPISQRIIGPVMDAQRAVSLTRANASKWNIDPDRIGILGFSAGGHVAVVTATQGEERTYTPVDDADKASCGVNFALPIYPGGLTEKDSTQLRPYIKVTSKTPPMFFAVAQDDQGCQASCLAMYTALTREKVPAEMHIFTHGGHGYGLRPTETPVTNWSRDAGNWMKAMGFDSAGRKKAG